MSWCRAQSGTFDQRFFFFFFKLQSCLIWGALSDERSGLSLLDREYILLTVLRTLALIVIKCSPQATFLYITHATLNPLIFSVSSFIFSNIATTYIFITLNNVLVACIVSLYNRTSTEIGLHIEAIGEKAPEYSFF
jgi:hypothetical protein